MAIQIYFDKVKEMKQNLLTKYETSEESVQEPSVSLESDNRDGNENHSLFIKEMEDGTKVYRLFVGAIMDYDSSLNSTLDKLIDAGMNDVLEARISSPGGFIEVGLKFVNLIENQFKGRAIGVIDTTARSMGSAVFCNCDKRIVYKSSEIMFHNYSTFTGGKGSNVIEQIEHQEDVYTEMLYAHTVEKGFLTEEEFEKLKIGKDYWFDAVEMLKRGIATHIMIGGHDIEAKYFLIDLENGLDEEEILSNHLARKHGAGVAIESISESIIDGDVKKKLNTVI